MFISPRYLANIENNGQHPQFADFLELMLQLQYIRRPVPFQISLLKEHAAAAARRAARRHKRYGDSIVTATAKEIVEVEKEDE